MNREEAAAHDSGDCLVGCSHPDHAFDGELIVLDLFDNPEALPPFVYVEAAADENVEPVFL